MLLHLKNGPELSSPKMDFGQPVIQDCSSAEDAQRIDLGRTNKFLAKSLYRNVFRVSALEDCLLRGDIGAVASLHLLLCFSLRFLCRSSMRRTLLGPRKTGSCSCMASI